MTAQSVQNLLRENQRRNCLLLAMPIKIQNNNHNQRILMFAFEITTDDVLIVCKKKFAVRISDSDAKKLFDSLDTSEIESAALDG